MQIDMNATRFEYKHEHMKYICERIEYRSGAYWVIYRINESSMSRTKMLLTDKSTWGNVSVAPKPLKFDTFYQTKIWLESHLQSQRAA